MDVPIFKDGRAHIKNSGVKELNCVFHVVLALIKADTYANSVDIDETAHMSRLIYICTVCHSVFEFD